MGYRILSMTLFIVTIFMIGCKTVNTAERAAPRATAQVVQDHRVVTDSSLANKGLIVQIREATAGGNLLKIQAEIVNTTSSRHQVNYRFEWIDQDGMVIDTSMSRWTQISLAGKESTAISSVAPTPKAVDFRLKLLEANN